MNAEDLRSLAERASTIEGRQDERLVEVHQRIRAARLLRASAATAGAAGLALAVVLGVSLATGPQQRSEEPVELPSPTPSETLDVPAEEVTYTADIGPDDIRGWETVVTRTNTEPAFAGSTDLSLTTTVTGTSAMHWAVSPFCRGSADTYYRLTFADGGQQTWHCTPDDTVPTAPDFPLITPTPPQMLVEGPAEVPVRMIVGRPDATWKDCFTGATRGCTREERTLRPVAETDVEFGFVVHQHPAAPTVLTVLGQPFEALAMTAKGEEYLVEKAVLAAAGASTLAVPLDPVDRDRIVGIYRTETPSWDDCRERLDTEGVLDDPYAGRSEYAPFDRQCTAELALRVDGEPAELHGTRHGLFGVTGSAVPPGARELAVDVVENDPRNVRYAVVIWQARP